MDNDNEKEAASKRELIEPHQGDKRYVRRKADGTFGKTVDLGSSLSADKKRTAKAKVAKGQATAATESHNQASAPTERFQDSDIGLEV
jgi:hypothetical protein